MQHFSCQGATNRVGADNVVLAGHGRLEAAKLLGWTKVPCIRLDHLSPIQRRAYVIADNKLAELAGWDFDLLSTELQGLLEVDLAVFPAFASIVLGHE